MAERLYDAFGLQALEVLDKEPERLLEVKGITESKLEKIKSSYLMNRGARDVIAFLAPHGVSPNRAVKLYQEYKGQTMDIVKNHPYRLCELAGIGFKTADTIAYSMGFDRLSAERVDAALLYTLTEAEENGHLCMEKHAFINACLKLLDTEGLTMMAAANRAAKLVENGQLVSFGKYVYRTKTAHAESHLAQRIRQFVRVQVQGIKTLDNELSQEEARLGVQFAPEQREAIKMALSHSLSIITGGPGTGKTMIQRAILDIYKRHDPEEKICYCAPTGRAARRMEDSTGFPASTIHRALNLMPGEEGGQNSPEPIDAKLIRNGYKTLEWGEDFAFVESPSIEGSAEKNIKRGVPVRPLRRGRRHLRPVRPCLRARPGSRHAGPSLSASGCISLKSGGMNPRCIL